MPRNRLIAAVALVLVAAAAWLAYRGLRHPEDRVAATDGVPRVAPQVAAAAGPGRPVLFVGMDGADWQLLDDYMERGLMPNLARLVATGRPGILESERPLLSPLLWTTMLTGTSPLEHRILDFTRFHPESGRQEPITSSERRVPAIWNMATAGGRSVASFGFWATYPAEATTGVMVSERLFSFFYADEELPPRTVYPAEIEGWAQEHLAAAEEAIDLARMRDFLPDLTADDYARHARSDQPYDHPISALRRILVETVVYHRLAMASLDRDAADLTLLYLQGTDTIGHTFASYAPPRQPSVPADEFERYHRVPELFFAYVDELLGEYRRRTEERGGVLLLASDHGFEWGDSRPTAVSSFDRDTAAFWHRTQGIYLLWGDGLPGEPMERRSGALRQVAATLLELLGLPPGEGVTGPPLAPLPQPTAPPVSYRRIYRPAAETSAPDEADVESELAKLRALGYLSGSSTPPPRRRGGTAEATRTAGSYNNEGVLLKSLGRLAEAEEAFRQTVAIDPARPAGHANLGLLTSDQDRHEEAIRHFRAALRLAPAAADSYLNLAAALVRAGRFELATEQYRRCVAALERAAAGTQTPAGAAECRRLLAAAESGALARPSPAGRIPTAAEVASEFAGLCEAVRSSADPAFGIGRVDALRQRLESPPADPLEAVSLQMELARELLRIGRPGEAAQLGGIAVQRAAAARLEIPVQLQALTDLGLAYLRIAEAQNCISRDLPAACALPPDTPYPEPAAALEALRALRAVLAGAPGLATVQWLANVAALTSGRFPAGLEPADRMPDSRLRSANAFARFREVARPLGLAINATGGGVAIDDFDNDGWLDVLTSSIDPCLPLRLFRNDGRGGFEEHTAAAGLEGQLGGASLAPADYDNDGALDVLVLRGAGVTGAEPGRNSLLRNNGDGTFADVTFRAGLAQPARATGTAAWADYDLDGDLDLYVGNQPAAGAAEAPPSQLFRNNGDGTFADVAEQAGVTNLRPANGVTFGDYDLDGDPDLFVSNLGANRLYRNDGGGVFTDVANALGLATPADHTTVTWWLDFDNDGDPDLFVASAEGEIQQVAEFLLGRETETGRPRLYRNDGGRRLTEVGSDLGLTAPAPSAGGGFGDLDNDGWLDIVLGTGLGGFEALMPNLVYRGDVGNRFLDVTRAGGFGLLHKGDAVAVADLDNDGDQDVYQRMGGRLLGDTYPSALFENPLDNKSGGAWVALRLVGTESNHSAIGARLEVTVDTAAGPRVIHRTVGSGGSSGASPLRQFIGLGRLASGATIPRIEVLWPASGATQLFENVRPRRFYELREGSPELTPLALQSTRLRTTGRR